MKATCMTLLLVLGSVAQPPRAALNSGDKSALAQADVIQLKIQQVLPQVAAIVKENPDNIEVRLGLSVLYDRYPASLEDTLRAEEQWREILRVDPSNRPAWALLATGDILASAGRYRQRLEHLERMIASAENRSQKYIGIRGTVRVSMRRLSPSLVGSEGARTEVLIPQTPSPLYRYFADVSGRDVILEDFDAARRILKDKLRQELRDAVEISVQAERADPDNALYNYLRACLYFLLEEDEAAITQVCRATQKEYLNTYFTEKRSAVSKVLRRVGFPDTLRREVEDTYAPIGDVINTNLLKEHIFPLAGKYERQGDAKRAAEIYGMVLHIARHIREEPMPYHSDYNHGFSRLLERRVQERQRAP